MRPATGALDGRARASPREEGSRGGWASGCPAGARVGDGSRRTTTRRRRGRSRAVFARKVPLSVCWSIGLFVGVGVGVGGKPVAIGSGRGVARAGEAEGERHGDDGDGDEKRER